MNAKTFGVAVLIVGMLGFCAWVWLVRQPQQLLSSDTPASDVPPPTGPVEADLLEARSYEPGDCVSWESSLGTADTDAVDCDTPHLFQVAGSIDLGDVEAIGRDYPDADGWQVVTDRDCGPVVNAHLGAPLDPNGRWRLGIMHPTQQSWDLGDRTVWCGVKANDVDGLAVADATLPMTGRADPSIQALLLPTGQCRAYQPDGDSTPVGCDQPHQLEVAGTVRLPDAPSYPGEGAVDDACAGVARAYAAGTLSYSALFYDERSWAAGTRDVTCVVGVAGDVYGWGTRTGSLAAVTS